MKKKIPELKSEAEEFEFWSTADSTEYFDWSHARKIKFVNLKPTLRTISDLRQATGSGNRVSTQVEGKLNQQ
jgi:hypothetical protein